MIETCPRGLHLVIEKRNRYNRRGMTVFKYEGAEPRHEFAAKERRQTPNSTVKFMGPSDPNPRSTELGGK